MTVYIVQDQKFIESSILKAKFNFEPAREFGELDYLLPSQASPFYLQPVIEQLHAKLCDISPRDYLLLTGNPILMGLAMAIAADYSEDGNVQLLQWNGAKCCYIPVTAKDIFMQKSYCVPADSVL